LGFSFARVLEVLVNELVALPEGPLINNADAAHGPGVYVLIDGTVYRINDQGQKQGVPSIEVWNSLNIDNNFSGVVPGNDADRLLPVGPVLTPRQTK
jgi:hypothetical protein